MDKDKILETMSLAYLNSTDPTKKYNMINPRAKEIRKKHMEAALQAMLKELPEAEVSSYESRGHTVTHNNTSDAPELYQQLLDMREEL